jgi:hypothetical protein
MNWQMVKQAPGSFVTLSVVVTEITHKTGQYGAYALGKVQDGPGQVEPVMFTVAKGKVLPPDLAIGHRIIGAGRYDANTGKTKFYFNSFAQQQVPPQTPAPIPNAYGQPTTPIQAPPAPQPIHVPEKTPVDWDAKELRERRGYAIRDATLLIVALAEINQESRGMTQDAVVEVAETYLKYMYHGKEAVPNPAPANWEPTDEPPIDDSDMIPF